MHLVKDIPSFIDEKKDTLIRLLMFRKDQIINMNTTTIWVVFRLDRVIHNSMYYLLIMDSFHKPSQKTEVPVMCVCWPQINLYRMRYKIKTDWNSLYCR